MFKIAGTLLLLSPAIVNALYLPTGTIGIAREGREISQATIDRIENIAKLLIGIDESVDREMEQQNIQMDHFYMQQPVSSVGNTDHQLAAEAGTVSEDDNHPTASSPPGQEEKFSVVLADLKQVADTIREGISKANQNRQFRLVLRLRPLLNYVNQIQHNMEMLRTRVVAIATLSNLTESVSEVIDQFGDVMTSSLGLAGSLIPAAAVPGGSQTQPVVSATAPAGQETAASGNDKRRLQTNSGAETIRNQHRRPARPQSTNPRRRQPAKPVTPAETVSKSEIVKDTKKPEVEAQAVQPSSIQQDSEKIFKNIIENKPEVNVKVEKKP